MEASKRLYLTEDDRVVSEGDPDARWLYAIPGRSIPDDEAEKYGLVDGSVPLAEVSSEKAPKAVETPSEEVEPEKPKRRSQRKRKT